MLRNQRAEVDIPGPSCRVSCQLFANFRADLVTSAADGWTEMHLQLVRRESESCECRDPRIDDPPYGASPPGMKNPHYPTGMGKEDRNAVRDRYGQNDSALGREMSVGLASAKESFPPSSMRDHCRAMDLAADHSPTRKRRQLILKPGPAGQHFTNGVVT